MEPGGVDAMIDSLPQAEFDARKRRLCEKMETEGLDAICVFNAGRIFYISGFHHVATERPLVLVVLSNGDTSLLVPHLEEENVPVRTPWITDVHVYREYPGQKHPMEYLREIFVRKGISSKHIGVDSDGYGAIMGYRGPSLSEQLPGTTLTHLGDYIDRMRMVKSDSEIAMIRRSAEFGHLAHSFLQDLIEVGKTELDITLQASAKATEVMLKMQRPDYEPVGRGSGPRATLTSGPKTAYNHRRAGARKIKPGDVILTAAGCDYGGYQSELERTLIVGEPTPRIQKYFELETAAQKVAFDAIKPGIPCSQVEATVNEFLESENLMELTRTHIGHGIGIEGHEAPFLDVGDPTMIEPGMVFTPEPCLFVPGFAGFRHSDTVVVTEDGIDYITRYSRNLEDLIVPE